MSDLGPAQILDEVLAALVPAFTAHGYRKSARTFAAMGDGVARVVQFQTSQLKKPEEAAFTLNALVSAVAFHEAYTGGPFPRSAASAEPVIQASIGKLMPDGEPVWWGLGETVSSQLIAGEIGALLEERVFPFLARFRSEEALLAELSSGQPLPGFGAMRARCRAVLLNKAGNKDEARRVLGALLEENAAEGLEGFRASIHQLEGRLGL
jgi:hypothetical protein